MSEMVMANIRIPVQLELGLKKASAKEYLSFGEFIRSAAIRFLLRLGIFKQSVFVDLLSSLSKTSKHFDEEVELAALRELREKLWAERHANTS